MSSSCWSILCCWKVETESVAAAGLGRECPTYRESAAAKVGGWTEVGGCSRTEDCSGAEGYSGDGGCSGAGGGSEAEGRSVSISHSSVLESAGGCGTDHRRRGGGWAPSLKSKSWWGEDKCH